MPADQHGCPSLLRVTGALSAFLVALIVATPVTPAAADPAAADSVAAESAAPQLSIAVDNGRSSAAPGDRLDYVITVRNLGTVEVIGLQVTQTMPDGMEVDVAVPPGAAGAGGVVWSLDLAAAGEAVLRTTATVSETPAELLRLATVACASVSADGPPIVCASHSDQLPAGASADAVRAAAADRAAQAPVGPVVWFAAGGAGLLAVILLIVVARRRSTRVSA